MRVIGAVVATGTMILVLTACSGRSPEPIPTTPAAISTYIATSTEGESVAFLDLRYFEGELALTDQGCYGLARGNVVEPVVFPAGTTILPGASQISVPTYGHVAIGDHITGAGGWGNPAQFVNFDIPARCRADTVAVIGLDR